MMRFLPAAALLTILLAPSTLAAATTPSGVFDPPLETKKLAVPQTKATPKATLTCRYYAHFMVKQVDEGEVGAAQISVVPIAGAKPACQRANVAAEKVFDPAAWSGYVKGAKGEFVFLDADDGVNGGLGFAVFAAGDGKKLFDDVAQGALDSATPGQSTITVRYKRNFAGDCSVPHDGSSCWTKIAAATGLSPGAAPDCAGGYKKAKAEMAKARCEADKKKGDPACLKAALAELDAQKWDEAPTVVIYAAETAIGPDVATTKPLGPALACHPSD